MPLSHNLICLNRWSLIVSPCRSLAYKMSLCCLRWGWHLSWGLKIRLVYWWLLYWISWKRGQGVQNEEEEGDWEEIQWFVRKTQNHQTESQLWWCLNQFQEGHQWLLLNINWYNWVRQSSRRKIEGGWREISETGMWPYCKSPNVSQLSDHCLNRWCWYDFQHALYHKDLWWSKFVRCDFGLVDWPSSCHFKWFPNILCCKSFLPGAFNCLQELSPGDLSYVDLSPLLHHLLVSLLELWEAKNIKGLR